MLNKNFLRVESHPCNGMTVTHLDSEILIMDEVLAVGDMAFQKKCLNKMCLRYLKSKTHS